MLGFGDPDRGGHFFERQDLSIALARDDRPVTRHAHLGLVASSREQVDEFWRRLTEQGFRNDGPPGLREKYRPSYYGAFVLDPDGNSVEAVLSPKRDFWTRPVARQRRLPRQQSLAGG